MKLTACLLTAALFATSVVDSASAALMITISPTGNNNEARISWSGSLLVDVAPSTTTFGINENIFFPNIGQPNFSFTGNTPTLTVTKITVPTASTNFDVNSVNNSGIFSIASGDADPPFTYIDGDVLVFTGTIVRSFAGGFTYDQLTPGVFSGGQWAAVSSNSQAITLTIAPEPSALMMFGCIGAFGIGLVVMRRRSSFVQAA